MYSLRRKLYTNYTLNSTQNPTKRRPKPYTASVRETIHEAEHKPYFLFLNTNLANGIQNANGADGANGIQNANGADGANGIQNANVADGANGIQNANGADGADGIQNANGTNGIQNANGANRTLRL